MNTLLIIEDDAIIRSQLREFLEMENYKILEAENGVEGLKLTKEHHPNLILSDLMMPKMDGFTLLKNIQANPEIRSIPFVFLTARSELQTLRTAMNLGAEDFLYKPFEFEELLHIIDIRLKRQAFLRQETEMQVQTQAIASQALTISSQAQKQWLKLMLHDVSNNLSGITNLTYALKKTHPAENIKQEVIEALHLSARSSQEMLTKIMKNLIENPQNTKAILSVPEILEHVKESLAASIEAKKILIVTKVPNRPVYTVGDPLVLYTILHNLISNAIKFTPKHNKIYCHFKKDKREWCLEIHDSGKGLNKTQIKAIQNSQNFTYPGTEGEKGTGMGLNLTHKLLPLLNARLEISSNGKGSHFFLYFPAYFPASSN
ncbi:hypothetical protein COW36_16365 [bacterium (Candidatus Blackallbacteria) CG17_big_fil_post_rev_8_21_14_2_50_48_46]|uniref:histidine kinase n=1 Tax=bacterium (Candidatus Blackallbacteria) CG17_big_fil_post_rev_8_21_14_2_50_48_46 TaxID=2014261 RepID=A0A2M7G1Q5_9BACT|nr:MAG: hypothetical protein COW64_08370 [bacterium (Candidatus Blackallbacteria) CG18_big_fil_WC_8_21_14_2_50_49_26]PIW15663.1 MAG: hypothetical protein COW36_16365 [bacterium (Candidatus Blackallbacteria) CG17_big_fil_post_rev_8_21_14_2_50_48_46]PIW47306.1 MAG: hypothetical protein COW20_13105 [bacterium (Candidatus Blackallbacteria) CG13_big_fil_rev_8_21_14_2_50_49_14]